MYIVSRLYKILDNGDQVPNLGTGLCFCFSCLMNPRDFVNCALRQLCHTNHALNSKYRSWDYVLCAG